MTYWCPWWSVQRLVQKGALSLDIKILFFWPLEKWLLVWIWGVNFAWGRLLYCKILPLQDHRGLKGDAGSWVPLHEAWEGGQSPSNPREVTLGFGRLHQRSTGPGALSAGWPTSDKTICWKPHWRNLTDFPAACPDFPTQGADLARAMQAVWFQMHRAMNCNKGGSAAGETAGSNPLASLHLCA